MRMPILKGIAHRIYRILAEVESGEPSFAGRALSALGCRPGPW